jgi:hypothetical protein
MKAISGLYREAVDFPVLRKLQGKKEGLGPQLALCRLPA